MKKIVLNVSIKVSLSTLIRKNIYLQIFLTASKFGDAFFSFFLTFSKYFLVITDIIFFMKKKLNITKKENIFFNHLDFNSISR